MKGLAIFYFLIILMSTLGSPEDEHAHYGTLFKKTKNSEDRRCALTLLTVRIILTTACCFIDSFKPSQEIPIGLKCHQENLLPANEFLVVLNLTSKDLFKSELETYIVHPKASKDCIAHNIALGRTEKDVPIGKKVKPLPFSGTHDHAINNETECHYIRTNSIKKGKCLLFALALYRIHLINQLNYNDYDDYDCYRRKRELTQLRCGSPGVICAKSAPIEGRTLPECIYDTGSALVCYNHLAGLLQPGKHHCVGKPKFLNISLHSNWLKTTIGTLSNTVAIAHVNSITFICSIIILY